MQSVPLHLVDRIILEDGTVVWTTADSGATGMVATQDTSQSAATKYYSSPQGHQAENTSASFTVRNLGILLIAGSGVLGYINNNKECDNCDAQESDDFYDEMKSRANLQYGSLFLGAILMLVGENMNLVVPASE